MMLATTVLLALHFVITRSHEWKAVRLVTGTPAPVPTPTPQPKPSLLRQPRALTGPLALQTLYGRCFVHREKNYEYVLCPFHNITQRDVSGTTWGTFYGVLGVWDDWIEDGSESAPTSQLYTDGTECGFKRRLAKVHISCGQEARLASVSEPSTCEYALALECPEVCATHVVDTAAVARAKALAANADSSTASRSSSSSPGVAVTPTRSALPSSSAKLVPSIPGSETPTSSSAPLTSRQITASDARAPTNAATAFVLTTQSPSHAAECSSEGDEICACSAIELKEALRVQAALLAELSAKFDSLLKTMASDCVTAKKAEPDMGSVLEPTAAATESPTVS